MSGRYYNNSMRGGAEFWSTKMNQDGFMGFVDKTWILYLRILTIFSIIGLVCTIFGAFFLIGKAKEKYDSLGTTRLRHQNTNYN